MKFHGGVESGSGINRLNFRNDPIQDPGSKTLDSESLNTDRDHNSLQYTHVTVAVSIPSCTPRGSTIIGAGLCCCSTDFLDYYKIVQK